MTNATTTRSTHFAIIGGGIAGASLAYWLARDADSVILERESQPGYHATGRSAAMFIESYGPPLGRLLTVASGRFYRAPPDGFCAHPLLTPRGAMHVGRIGDEKKLDAVAQTVAAAGPCLRLSAEEVATRVPVLNEDYLQTTAVFEPNSMDLDVHALHQGYLRGARQVGCQLLSDFDVTAITRTEAGWRIESPHECVEARVLINAAGAWCDEIAQLAGVEPIGLTPKRRSAFTFDPPPGIDCRTWPAVMAADESFYFKPDAGQLLGSPANADPAPPHDVQPEEYDIALGIHHIENGTSIDIRRPTRTWAGLRSFVADGEIVGGFDPAVADFFWLAGQGGFGIQSSAAMGRACAALLRGQPLPEDLSTAGLSAAGLSPARLRKPA